MRKQYFNNNSIRTKKWDYLIIYFLPILHVLIQAEEMPLTMVKKRKMAAMTIELIRGMTELLLSKKGIKLKEKIDSV